MSFEDLPFNHTQGLALYSDLVTNALPVVQSKIPGAQIQKSSVYPESRSSFTEDGLKYWVGGEEEGSIHIAFGRYLVFTSHQVTTPVHFWVGLNMPTDKPNEFIIWFEKTIKGQPNLDTSLQQLKDLNSAHIGARQLEDKKNEVYFVLEDTEFQDFCNTPHLTKDMEAFLQDVLSELKE